MLVGASRNGLDDLVAAASTTASTTSERRTMTPAVAVALGALIPTICLSGVWSSRVSLAFGVALAIVGPIELLGIGPLLEANHPLRVALPAILGALAYSELYASGSSWPRLSRAYIMALLTFALAGVDVAALFFHALGGAWIVPSFTILVCAMICTTALIPEGRVKWLLS